MPRTARQVNIRTNYSDRLVVELIPGSVPYLWIGERTDDGEPRYLGTVTVRAVLGAVKRSQKR